MPGIFSSLLEEMLMSCKLDKSLQFYRKAIQCLLAVKRNKVANGGKITLDEKIEYQSKAW